MQSVTEEVTENKKNIKKAIYLFIAVMLFLTFFSSTINNFMLPRVKIVNPVSGVLIKEVQASGVIQGKDVYKAYVKNAYQVEDVRVQTGESVKKGQLLMVIDKKDLARKLQDENDILEQKKIALARCQAQMVFEEHEMARKIADAKDTMDQKQRAAEAARQLFAIGAEARNDLEKAEAEAGSAKRAYEKALDGGDPSPEQKALDVRDAQVEVKLQESKVAEIEDEMKNVGDVVAPGDGVISELNCTQGSLTDPAKPLYALVFVKGGFELKVNIDSTKADFFVPGDEVEVSVPSSREGQFNGKIRSIGLTGTDGKTDNDQKEVVIDIASASLKGGEHAEIHIKKESKNYDCLIPNEAVRCEKNRYFVYTIQNKDGALGQEHYIEKVNVFCLDSDDSLTAVSGLFAFDEVVRSSNKTITEGDRVKTMVDEKKGGH